MEFVRTPFYDLAKMNHLKEGEDAQQFLTNVQLKLGMTNFLTGQLSSHFPTKESVAFKRYADKVYDERYQERL